MTSLEAAFIYRFMYFLPGERIEEEYSLCVKNNPQVYNALHGKLEKSKIFTGTLKILDVQDDYSSCSLLYLGEKLTPAEIVKVAMELDKHKILIVSKNGMNKSMAMINLKIKTDKVKFDANKTLMKLYEINLSSKVLRLADKVF
jgi:hypothetical protein